MTSPSSSLQEKNHLEEIPMSSGGESLSYFPLSFKEALHLGVIYAGMARQCQELLGGPFFTNCSMALRGNTVAALYERRQSSNERGSAVIDRRYSV